MKHNILKLIYFNIIILLFLLFLLFYTFSCTKKENSIHTKLEQKKNPVEIKSSVDKTEATIGDIITYTITIDYDSKIKPKIPEFGAEISGFRIIDFGEEKPIKDEQRIILKKWYKLSADIIGTYILPAVEVKFIDNLKKEKKVKTSEIFIEIKSVLKDNSQKNINDIIDIKPPVPVKIQNNNFLLVIGIITVVIIISLIYFLYIRKLKTVNPEPQKPAHEIALNDLEKLKNLNLDLNDYNVLKKYYFSISEIFRNYLKNRFNILALERPSEEIIAELINIEDINTEQREIVGTFLTHTDLVKFSKLIPDKEQPGIMYKKVYDFVNQTKIDTE